MDSVLAMTNCVVTVYLLLSSLCVGKGALVARLGTEFAGIAE